ncbi:dihydroneopterin aldolase [Cyphellophora europaea CBS 101466]|uniref:dihydroneopterin aldolase n=1 Tax=Cyphellophora europaea (strain CBS 101466) TaxID=1220924 RepID=W2SGA5_CYPE1|nr:dihydroneopterin aldolase [Cyphellophora europaea CBS 101466]ETN47033.1 dihydroneopterin aldolase [Cyphellophora europaea CBS 101466]
MDTIILRDLKFELAVGRDAWRRAGKLQPVSITLNLQPTSTFEAAALQDDVNLTLDYGKLYRTVFSKIRDQIYGNVQGLMLDLARCVEEYKLLGIDIVMPKAVLEAEKGLHYHLRIDKSDPEKVDASWSMAIKGIGVSCIIGVNPHERQYKQKLSVDLILGGQPLEGGVDRNELADPGLQEMCKSLVERVEGSSYQTVEALGTAVAQVVTMDHNQPIVTVLIEKPSAIATIETAAIQLTRSRAFFENKDFWKVKRP